MSSLGNSRWSMDWTLVVPAVGAFVLPLTLLVADAPASGPLPRLRVSRLHSVVRQVPWTQMYTTLALIAILLFCLLLEFRRRRLDDMVETVLLACEISDMSIKDEKDELGTAAKTCINLLDSAVDHYERVEVLGDELRRRDRPAPRSLVNHRPPAIQASDTVVL